MDFFIIESGKGYEIYFYLVYTTDAVTDLGFLNSNVWRSGSCYGYTYQIETKNTPGNHEEFTVSISIITIYRRCVSQNFNVGKFLPVIYMESRM